MKTVTLDGSGWKTTDDFYDAFFTAVAAPAWHGRNLDALRDSIRTRGINEIELPHVIRISGLAIMSPEACRIVERFKGLVQDLQADGDPVAIELLD